MACIFSPPRNLIRRCWPALAGVLAAGNALAQPAPAEEERWFQVEMIVFSQGNAAVEGEEIWHTDVDHYLFYPSDWVELTTQAELDAEREENLGQPNAQAPQTDTDTAPEGLVLLPDEQLELRGAARQLSRSNQFRLLFHGAWRQPLTERPQAPAILMQAGDQYGDHYELEGSVTFSVGRYLHVDTNLWLTQFATNFGQERKDWPELPPLPNQPYDPDAPLILDDRGGGLWGQTDTSTLPTSIGEYRNVLSRPYIIENIAVMNGTRRMYSGELHYLDHPLLGVLVKVIPYELPDTSETLGDAPLPPLSE